MPVYVSICAQDISKGVTRSKHIPVLIIVYLPKVICILLTDAPSHLHVTGRRVIAVILAEFPAQPATLTTGGRALTPVGPLLPGQRLKQVWVQDAGAGRVLKGDVSGTLRRYHGDSVPSTCMADKTCLYTSCSRVCLRMLAPWCSDIRSNVLVQWGSYISISAWFCRRLLFLFWCWRGHSHLCRRSTRGGCSRNSRDCWCGWCLWIQEVMNISIN